ncbi:leucine-rich repeat and transmembrane domain-containing protein 1-like [Periplaneta americana]|uniref:leucine-rich repeat and transmembrane domain-containing protein 1-like n=1 Tax=Periplaneta americana TaxID=6978 RepID=UPI0037E91A72
MNFLPRRIATLLLLLLLRNVSSCPAGCTCENAEIVCRSAALTSIPSDLQEDAVVLDLSFNNISMVSNNDLDEVPRLRELSLSDNDIERLEPEAFIRLEGLETIDLHNNKLEHLHRGLFQTNTNLTNLDLSNNNIEELKLDFTFNTELKILNLSRNMLTFDSLSDLSALSSLEILDISNNKIEILDEAIFIEMSSLSLLDMSGNPLDYDCHLRTVWALCSSSNITCLTDDEQSWRMVENLDCETEEPEALALTEELLEVNETNVEASEVEGSGSGMEPTETGSPEDGSPEPTDEKTDSEAGDTSGEEDWTMIGIIAGSVCGVIVVIVVAVFFICRRIKANEENSGNLSRTNSIGYINQTDQFNSSYHNSRNGNNKPPTHYDNVIPSESNRNILQFQVGDNIAAEVVRVPSFKTRGVSTPLNLPTEVSPEETGLIIQNPQYKANSLSRSSPMSTYEQNTTVRAGSLKKYRSAREAPTTNSRFIVPEVRNVPSIKRK